MHCILKASEKVGGFCMRENCEGQLALKADCLDNGKQANALFQEPWKFLMPNGSLLRRVKRGGQLGKAKIAQTIRVQFDLNVKLVNLIFCFVLLLLYQKFFLEFLQLFLYLIKNLCLNI